MQRAKVFLKLKQYANQSINMAVIFWLIIDLFCQKKIPVTVSQSSRWLHNMVSYTPTTVQKPTKVYLQLYKTDKKEALITWQMIDTD